MPKSEVELGGLTLKNPIIAGSCSLNRKLSHLAEMERAGVSAVVTPTIAEGFEDRVCTTTASKERWRIYGDRRIDLEEGAALIASAAETLSLPIIASIRAERGLPSWLRIASKVKKAGARALELDLYLPDNAIREGGSWVARVVQRVKQESTLPVFCKLTAHGDELVALALACQEAGADGIVTSGYMTVFPGIDVDKGGRPLFAGLKVTPLLSGSGPWMRPMVLMYTALLASSLKIPVITGDGGLNYKEAVEHLMLGARAVQLTSLLLTGGPGAVSDCVAGLKRFLAAKGYASVEEIWGLGQKYIVPRTRMTFYPIISRVIEEKCTGCWICLERLADCQAFVKLAKKVVVDEEKCTGCSLCVAMCPENAFVLEVKRDVRMAGAGRPH